MTTRIKIFGRSVLVFLTFILHECSATGRITPLTAKVHHNGSACIAENLRLSNKYTCDSIGNVICLPGWSQPEHLCETPVCSIEGRSCVNGECIFPNVCSCEIGWDGPSCAECIPLAGCQHGSCKGALECNCEPGWTGGQCEKPKCNDCVNGCCHEPNKCICDPGWQGINCTECETLSNCINGKCFKKPFECVCNPGWKGNGCAEPICRDTCHPENGYCQRPGECICKHGWSGRDCTECVPYPDCNGTCVNNVPWTCTDLGTDNEAKPGQWSLWSTWSSCSKSCGDGEQRRDRTCGNGERSQQNCVGQSSQGQSCVIANCKIDGEWARWTRWSPCSTSCGTGFRSRSRACSDPIPRYGGNKCSGSPTETVKCFSTFCPIAGRWSSWQQWGQLSVSCGEGTRQRQRRCDSPAPAHRGASCIGESSQTNTLFIKECPVDAEWSLWSRWTACSKSCDRGQKSRMRHCGEPLFGGQSCPGNITIEKDVIDCWVRQVCTVDGKWSNWLEWSSCTVTCGGGTRQRRRNCDNPAPKFGGQRCLGSEFDTQNCETDSCPIDGRWSQWRQWSQCSKTCGSGSQKRERVCNNPRFGGKACTGLSIDNRNCNQHRCPLDGKWELWGQWSKCSASCNGGNQSRKRVCTDPKFGGQPCTGNGVDNKSCNERSCAIDGKWNAWRQWSSCTKSCRGGTQKRERACDKPQFGGRPCNGTATETQGCNIQISCAVDGKWNLWGQWSQCSASCGGGVQSRDRKCIQPKFGGNPCDGPSVDAKSCNEDINCPIEGFWAQWGFWSSCSSTCNGGFRNRKRKCNQPQFNGAPCLGSNDQSEHCNNDIKCPIHGEWGQWGFWSSCSSTCQGGTEKRRRPCIDPQHGGLPCNGLNEEDRACNGNVPCAINGKWAEWGIWSSCTSSCIGGSHSRKRDCIQPQNGGIPCSGQNEDIKICNSNISCAVDGRWAQWGLWSSCSSSCTGGTHSRQRECESPLNGGFPCRGNREESQACNAFIPCAVDGAWAQWGFWSSCSSSCTGGSQTRQRNCDHPENGGLPCNGNREESQPCNTFVSCAVDGNWAQWGFWSSCSSSCTGGTQSRQRDCDHPENGGLPCNGNREEIQACNTFVSCSVDGAWAQWGFWSSCSSSCTGGTQSRQRNCDHPENGGLPCHGNREEIQACNTFVSCSVDGKWTQWGFWSSCSSSCTGGSQTRQRECDHPQNGGFPCHGNREESQACNINIPCPSNAEWSNWREWSTCSVTCSGGFHTRDRECHLRSPGDRPCVGVKSETNSCNQHISCHGPSRWSQWSYWSLCSVSCNGGVRTRSRACDIVHFNGLPCEGNNEETHPCNVDVQCPIDGQWAQWGYWSSCSVTCGGGTQHRERICKTPRFGGIFCSGQSLESHSCNQQPCFSFGEWSQWFYWSSCSVTCGDGSRSRHRSCSTNQCDGGLATEESHCNDGDCFPVGGLWSEWSFWSSCSSSCGDGIRNRQRSCDSLAFGQACDGELFETNNCNDRPCGVDGQWGHWNTWGLCSVTCGIGARMRERKCDSPAPQHGGNHCNGAHWENGVCEKEPCSIVVNGSWGFWGTWSSCSRTCGNGTQTRSRDCNNPQPSGGGSSCQGRDVETHTCLQSYCAIDGGLSEWTIWSPCTAKCLGDRGDRVRRRFCNNPRPKHGGKRCIGDIKQKEFCTGNIPKQENDPSTICFNIGEK
nr:SCO-spondin-like isoform X6 [Lepeophtheirus salmonis]